MKDETLTWVSYADENLDGLNRYAVGASRLSYNPTIFQSFLTPFPMLPID